MSSPIQPHCRNPIILPRSADAMVSGNGSSTETRALSLFPTKPLSATPLPTLKQTELNRLNEILETPFEFSIFDQPFILTLSQLLHCLPESDIQLVGSTLKYILGNDWFIEARQTAIAIGIFDGEVDELPLTQNIQRKSDIDIRIWPKNRGLSPEQHANQFIENLARYYNQRRNHTKKQTLPQIVNELRKNGGPFLIFEPRIRFENSEIIHETFLASHKGKTDLDLYFARILNDPITLIDEDIYLPLTDYNSHRSEDLIPSGSTDSGWQAVLSIIGKIIVPVKRDPQSWLRAMRREIEGYRLHNDDAAAFCFPSSTKLDLLIPSFLHRSSVTSLEERFALLLNMVAYSLRVETESRQLQEVLAAIHLEEIPKGFCEEIYGAAREVGWASVIALLRLTQNLDDQRRWKRVGFFCNLSIPFEKALHIYFRTDLQHPALKPLSLSLDLNFEIEGHEALLYKLTEADRKLFCNEFLRFSKYPSRSIARLFYILLKISYYEAKEFIKFHYKSLMEDGQSIHSILDKLNRPALGQQGNGTQLERVQFFLNLAAKFHQESSNKKAIEEQLNEGLYNFLAVEDYSMAALILQQGIHLGPFNRDPAVWMTLLSHLYQTHKKPGLLLQLMHQAHEWQLWTRDTAFEQQSRFFMNIIQLMLGERDKRVWQPIAYDLTSRLLESHIAEVYKIEVRKMHHRIVKLQQELEIMDAHIPEDLGRLNEWSVDDGQPIPLLFSETIRPLIKKVIQFPDGHPCLDLVREAIPPFLQKVALSPAEITIEEQKELYLFAINLLNKKVDKEKCLRLLYAVLDSQRSIEIACSWVIDLLKQSIIKVEDPIFKAWISEAKQTPLVSMLIQRLFTEKLEEMGQLLLNRSYTKLDDELLASFASKIPFESLYKDLSRSVTILKLMSLREIGAFDFRQERLNRFKEILLTPPLTEHKCQALAELSPFTQPISAQHVQSILRNCLKGSNIALKTKIWIWYRAQYHLPLNRIDATTKISKETIAIHKLSMKLLNQLNHQTYRLIQPMIQQFLESYCLIQIIVSSGDNSFHPDVVEHVREDLISLISSYIRIADPLHEDELENIFLMLQAHSAGAPMTGDKYLLSNSLMYQISKKVVDLHLDPAAIALEDLQLFLKGWKILRNLLYRIDENDRKLAKQLIQYMNKSALFSNDHFQTVYKEVISPHALSLLNLNHPYYSKFDDETRKKIARDFLAHPIIVQQDAHEIASTHVQLYFRLKIKQMIEPLSDEDEKLLGEQMRRLEVWNWRTMVPHVNLLLGWVTVLHIIWVFCIAPYQQVRQNETEPSG